MRETEDKLVYYGYPSFQEVLAKELAKTNKYTKHDEVAREIVDFYLHQYKLIVYITVMKGDTIGNTDYVLTNYIEVESADSISSYWKK